MKTFPSAAMALAIMTTAGLAFTDSTGGTIKSIDPATRVITLDNGKTIDDVHRLAIDRPRSLPGRESIVGNPSVTLARRTRFPGVARRTRLGLRTARNRTAPC